MKIFNNLKSSLKNINGATYINGVNCCVTGEPEYKPYTHVLFINGYRKDSLRIEKKIESITIGKPKKGLCPDKWLDTEFFIIKFK